MAAPALAQQAAAGWRMASLLDTWNAEPHRRLEDAEERADALVAPVSGDPAAAAETPAVAAHAAGLAPVPTLHTVVAYPFMNFGDVNRFIIEVRRAPGVTSATPRRIRGGTVRLTVAYAGDVSLGARLAGLPGLALRLKLEREHIVSLVRDAVPAPVVTDSYALTDAGAAD